MSGLLKRLGSLLTPISPGAKRAVVILFTLTMAIGAVNLLFTVEYYKTVQANERRQGAAFEQKLCATLSRLAALEPPAGSAAGNPSRAYLQREHTVLAELGPDVGCRRMP